VGKREAKTDKELKREIDIWWTI